MTNIVGSNQCRKSCKISVNKNRSTINEKYEQQKIVSLK